MKVFICGITGTQGSALAHALLPSSTITVVGLTRSPSTPAAAALTSLGAHLMTGSYADADVLTTALAGCTALFLNPMPSWTDADAERRDGLALLAAAKATGTVAHVVYSAALSTGAPKALPNYDPALYVARMLGEKHVLESAVRDAGIPRWTILRPGNFMSNYVGDAAKTRERGLVYEGVSRTAFTRDTKIPMVDPQTIAEFARAALRDPEAFHGQEVDLADEVLMLDETLAKLSAATGRELRAEYMEEKEVEAQKVANPIVGAQYLMRDMVDMVDMEKMKTWGVPTSSFDAFLRREAALVKETYDVEAKSA